MVVEMMTKREGVHNESRKERTQDLPIVKASVPSKLVFPLDMHIGAPAEPVVEKGDYVKIGTMIAERDGAISANIYSSISGKVIDISEQPTLSGNSKAITIKNDYEELKEPPLFADEEELSLDQMKEVIEKAGIVGMGGATFPTDVKLSPPDEKKITTLIINGAECEPYSTADGRLITEHAKELVEGVRILIDMLEVDHIYIALERDMKDSIKALKKTLDQEGDIKLVELETIYPQGDENKLIKTLTNREVPAGGLPADVQTVVTNVATTYAIYDAIEKRQPLINRVTTVSGEPIKDPKNLLVRIGTPINHLIEECNGFRSNPGKVVHGGPMMGFPIKSGRVPVTKGTSVITFLEKGEATRSERSDCIKCSECLNVCPVSLQPILISQAYENGDIEEAERLGAMDCIDCGNCSFICPAKIPLLDNIRAAKEEISAKQEEE